MTIYERALEFVAGGMAVGLSSGRAATEFTRLLGERVRAGLRVRAVTTSVRTTELAAALGIPVVPLGEGMPLELASGHDGRGGRAMDTTGTGGAPVAERQQT